MARSGKTITFATDLLPNEDDLYQLGKIDDDSTKNRRWIIYASEINGPLIGNVTGNVSGSAGSVAWTNVTGRPTNVSDFTNDAGYLQTAVTSIQVSASSPLAVDNANAVTTTGSYTISFSNQAHNTVLAGPSGTGDNDAAPTFRSLINEDLPLISIGKGGTNNSSFTDGQVIYPATFNDVQSLTGNTNFTYDSSTHELTLGKLSITGGTTDSTITNATGTLTISTTGNTKSITINSKSTLYLNTSAAASIVLKTNDTVRARINPNGHFIPESSNSYTLGLAANGTEANAKRWQALYVGTNDAYGTAYTPIYWNNGIPGEVTVTKKLTFSFTSSSTSIVVNTPDTNISNWIVTEIVVDTGIEHLKGSISWNVLTTGDNKNKIELTTTATPDDTVSGYILISTGS